MCNTFFKHSANNFALEFRHLNRFQISETCYKTKEYICHETNDL